MPYKKKKKIYKEFKVNKKKKWIVKDCIHLHILNSANQRPSAVLT